MVRWIIQQLNRLIDGVGKLHHTMEKLCTLTTALRTIIHFDPEQTRGRLFLFVQSIPFGFEYIHDEVTRFVGTAKGDVQLGAVFIHNPAWDILLLTTHIVITGLTVAPGKTAA